MSDNGYEIYAETADSEKKKEYWDAAIGMQKVDGLQPTEYLYRLAQENVMGRLTYKEVENLLYRKYEDETPENIRERQKEGDLVAARITQILDSSGYPLKLSSLKAIHRHLFRDIYEYAGTFRECNIYKKEPVLNGKSVNYTNYSGLNETLEYDFNEEKENSYAGMNLDQIIRRITVFTSSIWQAHPFLEGNTRTIAVFIECYLNNIGFSVDNSQFKEYSKYFRNALVRSNFADYSRGIIPTDEYLERFFRNLLTDDKEVLRNRDLILTTVFPDAGWKGGST